MAKLPLLTHTESSLGRAAHGVPSSPTSTFAEGFCNAFGKRRLPESAADGTSPNKHGRTNAHHVQNRSLSLSKAPMMLDDVDDVDDTLASNYGSTTTEIRRGLHEALSHSRERFSIKTEIINDSFQSQIGRSSTPMDSKSIVDDEQDDDIQFVSSGPVTQSRTKATRANAQKDRDGKIALMKLRLKSASAKSEEYALKLQLAEAELKAQMQ